MNNVNRIHFVYLCPRDKTYEETMRGKIQDAALHMQAFCRWQMGNGKTFTLTNPIVATYVTEHDSEWYSTFLQEPNMPHSEIYWANAQLDARDYAGARFLMPNDSWVIYLDAYTAGDQHAGGASMGGSGIAVLHGRDCDALRGEDPEWLPCREIGGGLHEALHTLGIPHPPAGPDFGRAVMGTGYTRYADAILTEEDKRTLDQHRFFSVRPKLVKPNICPFDDWRRIPAPRARPIPRLPIPIPHTIGDNRIG